MVWWCNIMKSLDWYVFYTLSQSPVYIIWGVGWLFYILSSGNWKPEFFAWLFKLSSVATTERRFKIMVSFWLTAPCVSFSKLADHFWSYKSWSECNGHGVTEECVCIRLVRELIHCQHLWWRVPKLWRPQPQLVQVPGVVVQMQRKLWSPWRWKPKQSHLWNQWRLQLHPRAKLWQGSHVPKPRQSRGQPPPLQSVRWRMATLMTLTLSLTRMTLPASQQQMRMGNLDLHLLVLISTRMLHRHHSHLCWVATTGTKRRHSLDWLVGPSWWLIILDVINRVIIDSWQLIVIVELIFVYWLTVCR